MVSFSKLIFDALIAKISDIIAKISNIGIEIELKMIHAIQHKL